MNKPHTCSVKCLNDRWLHRQCSSPEPCHAPPKSPETTIILGPNFSDEVRFWGALHGGAHQHRKNKLGLQRKGEASLQPERGAPGWKERQGEMKSQWETEGCLAGERETKSKALDREISWQKRDVRKSKGTERNWQKESYLGWKETDVKWWENSWLFREKETR